MLRDQLVIAKFVGPKPNVQRLEIWLQNLNRELGGNNMSVCREGGTGYFFLASDETTMIQNVLMLFLFETKWGMCMLQS